MSSRPNIISLASLLVLTRTQPNILSSLSILITFSILVFFHLTNESAPSSVHRNYRCSRRVSTSEACLSNKSLFHNDDEHQTCLQYDEMRCGQMNHTTPILITKIFAHYTEAPDQFAPPLTLYTWAPIGLAAPCVVAYSIGAHV